MLERKWKSFVFGENVKGKKNGWVGKEIVFAAMENPTDINIVEVIFQCNGEIFKRDKSTLSEILF